MLKFDTIVIFDSEDDTWTLYFTCEGASGGMQESSTIRISRSELTMSNLIAMKLQMGYRVRDYLYYKRRCGNAATLQELEEEDHVHAMIACNEVEKEVRLLLSKDQKIDQNVSITPLKVHRSRPIRDMNLDEDEEPIDAYKDWLANMHRQNRFTGKCYVVIFSIYSRSLCTNICLINPDLKDIERDDTTKTYKEWLRVERILDDISNLTSLPICLLLSHPSQSYYI